MSGHGDQETVEELRRKLESAQRDLEIAKRAMTREHRAAMRAVAAKDLELSDARCQLLAAGQAVAATEAGYQADRAEWRNERALLLHTVWLLHKKLYGPQSEKLDPEKIVELLAKLQEDEAPATSRPPDGSPEWKATGEATRKPKRTRKGHGRKELPDHLPRVRIEQELEPCERLCPCCNQEMERFDEEVSSHLEYIPASLHVIDHVRPKYACRNKGCGQPPKVAPLPPTPIPKGKAGAGLLAYLAVSKYLDHLPLDRQRRMFLRMGVEIAETTLVGWIAAIADVLLPLYRYLAAQVVLSRIVQTDDTVVPVLDPDRNCTKKGRLWVYLGDREHPYTVYDYTPTRSRDGPDRFLRDFVGYLQADAYAGYEVMFRPERAIEVACMAHARRKFHECLDQEPVRALEAIEYFRSLYDLERHAKAKGLASAERKALREREAAPILSRFRAWLDTKAQEGQILPKSPLSEAIGYARNQWAALNRYLEDGELEIDNNASERALRGVAVGRKNWMFAGSDEGAERAAILYTVLESAKRHDLNPLVYLRSLLHYLPGLPDDWVPHLAPDRWAATLAAVEVSAPAPAP